MQPRRGGVRNAEEILKDHEFVDANRERCVTAAEEMYSVFARYTNSESSTTVRSVTGLDEVAGWARLRAKTAEGREGEIFRTLRECMCPKPAKDVCAVRPVLRPWEEKRNASCLNSEEVCVGGEGEDSRPVEDVGSPGHLSEGREGADGNDTG